MPTKRHLDHSTVVQTAAELLKTEGAAALTLNRLAGHLGIRTPSLYNHINGLDDLYHGLAVLNARMLADRLTQSAIGLSGPDGYRSMAQAYRAYILENSNLYLLTLRASNPQNAHDADLQREEERSVQVGLAIMASFGLHDQEAIHAVRAVRSAVHGFATLEIGGGFGLPLDCDESFRRLIGTLMRGLASVEG